MKAVRWHGRDDIRVDDIASPGPPGPGEVLLDVLLCGVCGTDLDEFRHGPLAISVEPHPLTGARAPIVLGHEVLGAVAALGEGVTGLQVGDRVVPDGLQACGVCIGCLAGQPTLCVRLASIGLHRSGGMAEQLVVPASMCVVIAPGVPDEVAVLVEPVAVSVRAVRRARLAPSDRVLVIGLGTIGQCVTRLALRTGAEVGVYSRDPRRIAKLGLAASQVRTNIGPDDEEVADCVIDCAGTTASFAHALRAAARGGRIVLAGAADEAPGFSPLALTHKELTIITSLSHDLEDDTRPAAALLGELDLGGLVTRVVPISETVEAVFGAQDPSELNIKTVVAP